MNWTKIDMKNLMPVLFLLLLASCEQESPFDPNKASKYVVEAQDVYLNVNAESLNRDVAPGDSVVFGLYPNISIKVKNLGLPIIEKNKITGWDEADGIFVINKDTIIISSGEIKTITTK